MNRGGFLPVVTILYYLLSADRAFSTVQDTKADSFLQSRGGS